MADPDTDAGGPTPSWPGPTVALPSPNHGARRGANAPDMVVIHFTGMPDSTSARSRLCDPAAEVSAHWLIHDDARVEPLVAEDRRAWHAGAGSWQGRADVNSHSIGIEIANPGNRPFTHRQMIALADLLAGVLHRWSIPPARVIGHSDMAPDRKSDPGPRFDWQRLARQGLAIAAQPTSTDLPLEPLLDRIGYPPGPAAERLRAFRLRHAPWHDGPESPRDRDIAAGVLLASERDGMPIYKVLRAPEWAILRDSGETPGAPVDMADGYIHFSTARQLPATLAKHFAGETDLTLLQCDAAALSPDLRWEASRGGALFPHLYRPLRMADIAWHRPIALTDGVHQTGALE